MASGLILVSESTGAILFNGRDVRTPLSSYHTPWLNLGTLKHVEVISHELVEQTKVPNSF